MEHLPDDRMPEAEVSLRLALYLVRNHLVQGDVDVAIDGAQIKNLNAFHFPMDTFLLDERMKAETATNASWQGRYTVDDLRPRINVHSSAGLGDVVARLNSGKLLRIESKKGTLQRSKSSSEYPLIREAIGQIMTMRIVENDHLLGIAVPHSDKFAELCARWADAPLIQRAGLVLLRVHRDGAVDGLPVE